MYLNYFVYFKDEILNKIGYYLGVVISYYYDYIINRVECVDYSKNFEIVLIYFNEGEIRNYKNLLIEV